MTTNAIPQVNYYQVLGASPMDQLDRIEDLFRQLAYDAEQSGDHSRIPQAVEAFKILRDPAQRHHYDQMLAHQQHAQQQQHAQAPAAQAPVAGASAPYPPASPSPMMPPEQPQSYPPEQVQQQVSQYQPPPPQQAEQVYPGIHQPAPSQAMPVPMQQAPPTAYQATPSEPLPQQPVVSIPNIHAEVPVEPAIEQPEPPQEQNAVVDRPVSEVIPAVAQDDAPPEFCAATAQRRRREVLAMFYKRRRDDAKNPGLAIGGIESKVDYTYEVLEFHLWYMQQKEWLLRLESGMFTITYLGVEEHEKNLTEGLIR